MNLCKDCKHALPAIVMGVKVWRDARCSRPAIGKISPVDGVAEKKSTEICSVERKNNHPDSCGPEGQHFEEKR